MGNFADTFEDAYSELAVDDEFGVSVTYYVGDTGVSSAVIASIIRNQVNIETYPDGEHEVSMVVMSFASADVSEPKTNDRITWDGQIYEVVSRDTRQTDEGRQRAIAVRNRRIERTDPSYRTRRA